MHPTFPDALSRVRTALAVWRSGERTAARGAIVPGLAFEYDPKCAHETIDLSVPPTGLLRLKARGADMHRGPRLRIDLGHGAMPPNTVLGLMARWLGPTHTGILARLRSCNSEVPHEALLGRFDRLELARTQVLLHELYPRDPATREGAGHMLILELPPGDFDLTLLDIGGLHRPACTGPPAHGQTLTQLARSGAAR